MIAPSRYGVRYEYRLGTRLGRGGCADVYVCEVFAVGGNRLTPQRFAVKILRDAGQHEYRQRFRSEAELQARLSHPNLMPVVEANHEGDRPYIVMPLMKETLHQRLRRMRGVNQVFRAKAAIDNFLLPIAGAAEHLHRFGYFHRDIKPPNIMIGFDDVPMLGDFSICHAPTAHAQLKTWCGLGTACYTAPETLKYGIASPQSDIYSLGVVLYEMLMGGTPPFYWWNNPALRPSVQHPRSCHPTVDHVLLWMTHPEPTNRYATVAKLISDLTVLATNILPPLPSYRQPAPPPRLRTPLLLRRV